MDMGTEAAPLHQTIAAALSELGVGRGENEDSTGTGRQEHALLTLHQRQLHRDERSLPRRTVDSCLSL